MAAGGSPRSSLARQRLSVLLDSNIIIYAARPEHQALRRFIAEHAPAVSVVSYVEVLGYHRLTEQDRRPHPLRLRRRGGPPWPPRTPQRPSGDGRLTPSKSSPPQPPPFSRRSRPRRQRGVRLPPLKKGGRGGFPEGSGVRRRGGPPCPPRTLQRPSGDGRLTPSKSSPSPLLSSKEEEPERLAAKPPEASASPRVSACRDDVPRHASRARDSGGGRMGSPLPPGPGQVSRLLPPSACR